MTRKLNEWGSLLTLVCSLACTGFGQMTTAPQQQPSRPAVHSHRPAVRDTSALPALCAECVKSNLSYLAGPELHGRGSGTEDEHKAAEFIAAKLKTYGLTPAAGEGEYIQTGTVRRREVIGNPTLTMEGRGDSNPIVLTHGTRVVIYGFADAPLTVPLQKIDLSGEKSPAQAVLPGAAVQLKLKPGFSTDEVRAILAPYRESKAAILILPASAFASRVFDSFARQQPQMPEVIGHDQPTVRPARVLAKPEAFDQIWAQPDGTTMKLQAELSPWKTTNTWNVLAKIDGTTEKDQIILLSAHLDHLGVQDGKTYPGADDDASGTAAVMELARVLSKEPKPKRTIIVALWGSEELGMVGSRYFLQNPTFPLKNIVANLEFEMVGRPDAAVNHDQLWLTGWNRTNLGPELAKHGAKLVGDPHPSENFFMRSDNYAMAQQGIVAQTVSSFGLHPDYHRATDTLDKIDLQHIDQGIASMIGPVTWLANTTFKPEWVEGKKP